MGLSLIQKAIIKDTQEEDIVGFDSLIEIKPMMWAEYEFGALPKSLKRIAKNLSNMSFLELKIKKSTKVPCSKTIIVFADFNDVDKKNKIFEDILLLAKDKLSTKGYSYFQDALARPMDYEKPKYPSDRDSDFWWDIENDFMFFVNDGNQKLPQKLIIAFEKLQEKWKDELFPQKPKTFLEKLLKK